LDSVTTRRLNTFLDNLVRGHPEIKESNPLIQQINSAFSIENINKIITDARNGVDSGVTDPALSEAEKVKAARVSLYTGMDNLTSGLKLAAFLAETGVAKGMAIDLDGHDWHSGTGLSHQGSSVGTARTAAQMFAQIRLFWEWLGSRTGKNLQRRVLVVISHEFSRTPYNSFPFNFDGSRMVDDAGNPVFINYGEPIEIYCKGVKHTIRVPGRDHWLSAHGTVFLNAGVPPASRLGGIVDQYVAHGSRDLLGTPDPAVPGYTQLQLVGSMFMRLFPELFPDQRALRKIWPTMPEPIDLLVNG